MLGHVGRLPCFSSSAGMVTRVGRLTSEILPRIRDGPKPQKYSERPVHGALARHSSRSIVSKWQVPSRWLCFDLGPKRERLDLYYTSTVTDPTGLPRESSRCKCSWMHTRAHLNRLVSSPNQKNVNQILAENSWAMQYHLRPCWSCCDHGRGQNRNEPSLFSYRHCPICRPQRVLHP